jgi:predicted RNA-binding Zn-ribbon protein involved in translation (DUF1610 family)
MKAVFDEQSLPMPCPNCGHRINLTVKWFRGNNKLTCPDCCFIACLNTRDVKRELAKLDEAIDAFTKAFTRLSNQ